MLEVRPLDGAIESDFLVGPCKGSLPMCATGVGESRKIAWPLEGSKVCDSKKVCSSLA